MTSPREKRIRKLLSIQKTDLDRKQAALAQAIEMLRLAEVSRESAIVRRDRETEIAFDQLRRGATSSDWDLQLSWLRTLEQTIAVCDSELLKAQHQAELARIAALKSHQRMQVFEKLLEHSEQEHKLEVARQERSTEDEWATSRWSQTHSS